MEERRGAVTAAFSSVAAAVFLVTLKLVVGWASGSLGVLSEALHSGLDLAAAAVTFFAVRAAGRPADVDHHYGHGKIESLSALVEIAFLFIACGWIIHEAVSRILSDEVMVEASLWAFFVMAVSIFVDFSRSRVLYRAARKYSSQALEADALHFSTDMLSSSVVIIGLALVWLSEKWLGVPLRYFEYTMLYPLMKMVSASPLRHADSVAALLVSLIIFLTGFRLGRRAVDVLLDRAPARARELVENAVWSVSMVKECRRIRVRSTGSAYFVDVVITVDPSCPLAKTHEVASEVESKIRSMLPKADVMVHVEPAEVEGDVAERTRGIALSSGFEVHDVHVHKLNGALSVDLHLEVPSWMSLNEAHKVADELEEKVQACIEGVKEVNVHIEPSRRETTNSKDITGETSSLKVKEAVESVVGEGRCRKVTVREVDGRLSIYVNCILNGSTSIDEAHRLAAEAENEVRKRILNVEEVNVHLEPEETKKD
ncbi:MAG: cation-efflux pump [Candidatus Jordarchaeales archaeon]|nr:cation diffusion facilitator family transporter [Candidatus Jordarchaeia archaeon]